MQPIRFSSVDALTIIVNPQPLGIPRKGNFCEQRYISSNLIRTAISTCIAFGFSSIPVARSLLEWRWRLNFQGVLPEFAELVAIEIA